jgi:hypothetical protein
MDTDLKAARAVLDVLADQAARAEKALASALAAIERSDPTLALAVEAQLRTLKSCSEEMVKLCALINERTDLGPPSAR